MGAAGLARAHQGSDGAAVARWSARSAARPLLPALRSPRLNRPDAVMPMRSVQPLFAPVDPGRAGRSRPRHRIRATGGEYRWPVGDRHAEVFLGDVVVTSGFLGRSDCFEPHQPTGSDTAAFRLRSPVFPTPSLNAMARFGHPCLDVVGNLSSCWIINIWIRLIIPSIGGPTVVIRP